MKTTWLVLKLWGDNDNGDNRISCLADFHYNPKAKKNMGGNAFLENLVSQ